MHHIQHERNYTTHYTVTRDAASPIRHLHSVLIVTHHAVHRPSTHQSQTHTKSPSRISDKTQTHYTVTRDAASPIRRLHTVLIVTHHAMHHPSPHQSQTHINSPSRISKSLKTIVYMQSYNANEPTAWLFENVEPMMSACPEST